MGANYYWCSIDEIYSNRWVRCATRCPQLALLITKGSSTDTHTSCTDPSPEYINDFSPNKTDINTILTLHNNARSSVNPTALLMPSVTWDWRLARLALLGSRLCTGDCGNCRKLLNNKTVSIGQLSVKLYGKLSWQSAFNSWFSNTDDKAQIVADKLYSIGCGASECDTGYVYICNYATDSYDSKKPYLTGSTCTNCSSCSNNLCNCNKICQNYGTLNSKTCKCQCLPYATGDNCEIMLCDQNDAGIEILFSVIRYHK
jgi:hypothetical protein